MSSTTWAICQFPHHRFPGSTLGLMCHRRFPSFLRQESRCACLYAQMTGTSVVRRRPMVSRVVAIQGAMRCAMSMQCPPTERWWQKLRKRFRLPVPVLVLLGFVVPMLLVLLVAYLLRNVPSPEDACRKECAAVNRAGRLVYVYPSEMTAGMRSKGSTKCECY